MNNVIFIIISVIALLYVINNVRKNDFSIKESFWWVVGAIVMLILAIFPYSLDNLAKMLNIDYPPSLLFVLCIIFLLFQNFRSTKKISDLGIKIVELAEELAIVKNKVNKGDKK